MNYPSMSRTRAYTVSVPELNGGINLSSPPHRIADNQLSDAENVWYHDGMLQTRPSLKGVSKFTNDPYVKYRYGSAGKYGVILNEITDGENHYVTFVEEDGSHKVYHYGGDRGVIMTVVPVNGECNEYISGKDVIVYLKGKQTAGVFGLSKDENSMQPLTPYVPTVLMNGRPQAEKSGGVNGVQLEPYNMLSDEYICSFTSDGENLYYYLLDAKDIVAEEGFIIKWYNGEEYVDAGLSLAFDKESGLYVGNGNATGYVPVYDPSRGCFWFCEMTVQGDLNPRVAVAFPEGLDNNIVVRMKRSDTEAVKAARDTILGMQFGTWFGGTSGTSAGTRLFMGGNDSHPNLVHWSAANNPLYFPENNYAYVGEDDNAVTAFAKQGDMLVIFKENELYCTTYVQGGAISGDDLVAQTVIDIEAAAAFFPIMQVHPEVGCDCPGTIQLCDNRLVWLNSEGVVYGFFSAGTYSERNIRPLSIQIESRLRSFNKDSLKSATAARYEKQYLLNINGEILAMDYSSYGFSHYNNFSTEEKAQKNVVWHRWVFPSKILGVMQVGDKAFLVSVDVVRENLMLMNFADESCDDTMENGEYVKGLPIASTFMTKWYDFGHIDRRKRVDTVYLHISGDYENGVDVEYISGDDCYNRRDRIKTTGRALEHATPCRMNPNMVRVRQFGIRVTASGKISVGGMTLTYSTMGVVR